MDRCPLLITTPVIGSYVNRKCPLRPLTFITLQAWCLTHHEACPTWREASQPVAVLQEAQRG